MVEKHALKGKGMPKIALAGDSLVAEFDENLDGSALKKVLEAADVKGSIATIEGNKLTLHDLPPNLFQDNILKVLLPNLMRLKKSAGEGEPNKTEKVTLKPNE